MLNTKLKNFFLPILKKHKWYLFLLMLDSSITWVAAVLMPILLKYETDQLVEKNSNAILSSFSIFLIILWVILIVKIIDKLINWVIRIFKDSKEQFFRNDVQYEFFKVMENMEVWLTLSNRFQKLSNIIDNWIETFSKQILNFPSKVLWNTIKILWLSAVYAYFDITLLFIVIISSYIWYLISTYTINLREKFRVDWQFSLWERLYKYGHLFLWNFLSLATNWAIKSSLREYNNLLKEQIKHWIKQDWSVFFWDIADIINFSISDILIKAVVWYWVFYWTNSVGMVVLVVSSMETFRTVISSIFDAKADYKKFIFDQDIILLFFNICKWVWDEKIKDKNIDTITIKNLNFTYPNLASYEIEYIDIFKKFLDEKKSINDSRINKNIKKIITSLEEDSEIINTQIINDLNLTFEKWKVYWIVWKNWAWKTTLMYLLSWFFRSYKWNILFNDTLVLNCNQDSFWKKISYLTQIPFTLGWSSTIKENLTLWCDENIDEDMIWQYLKLFWLKSKIEKTKNKLESIVKEDIDFSWWEIQILAFIRLLLQNRQIIILDEWTNQLDAENEVLVMKELLKQKHDKIIIFITHRMSTISKADIIYCIDNWTISNCWNHKELLKNNDNLYAKFYKTQVLHEE